MKIARIAAALLLAAGLAAGETKVLRNFTLIDGTGKKPLPASAMVVTDGRIVWVGQAGRVKAPPNAETIDLSGKFVMPGIINLHCHLGNVAGFTEDQNNFTGENLERQLKLYASYGVTSVLSMGTDQDIIYRLRASQRAGRPPDARIFTAGRGFKGKDGYPDSPGMKGVQYEVTSAEEVDKAMAQLAGRRVDIVKVWVDDHLGRIPKISMDLCRAIIASARKYEMNTAAHVYYLADARQLVDAGLYALAHNVRDTEVDAALIASMKKHGSWLIPTLTREIATYIYAKPQPFLDEPFFQRAVPPAVLADLKGSYREKVAADPDLPKYPAFLDYAKKNTKKLFDAGVKIGFGTDSGAPARFPGYAEHWEMELMVEAGLTPAQVIVAATKSSAEFLGMSKELGTLEPGHWADLIVLAQDPLDNIRNTRTIEMVMIAGNKVN